MQIAVCALSVALLILLLLISRMSTRITRVVSMLSKAAERIASNERRIEDTQNYITEVETEVKLKVQDMDEQFSAAQELIQTAKEAAEEEAKAAKAAQETERRLQEGINSILNYSSQREEV